MDLHRLHVLLADCTIQLRKGEVVTTKKEGGIEVVHVYAMPHTEEIEEGEGDVWTKVDVHFVDIGVRRDRAEAHRNELVNLLDSYPEPDRLAGGPSYIEVGAVIGDQGTALQLFALGEILDLWEVITPERLGITGSEADALAGRGMVMISGYKKVA